MGLVLVCTDHNSFEECHDFSARVFENLYAKKTVTGPSKLSLFDQVDKCTVQMYQTIDMKEVKLIIVRNNVLNQYTTYNYPLLT